MTEQQKTSVDKPVDQAAPPPLPRIVFLNAWFGKWPAWINLYLASMRANEDIDFVLISDAPAPSDLPPNVRLLSYSFEDYRSYIGKTLGINPKWTDSFKLCDIRPALGFLHQDIIKDYDCWGYCDVDLILGDMRKFLTPEHLDADLISAHGHQISGHMTLYRNSERMLHIFKRPRHWRWLMSTPKHKSFDERIMSIMFAPRSERRGNPLHYMLTPKLAGARFAEQYSTPLPGLPWVDGTQNFPKTWYWKDGKLTTDVTGDREFMYFHFTHWASKRWTNSDKSVWGHLDQLIQVDDRRPDAFTISAQGFQPLNQ